MIGEAVHHSVESLRVLTLALAFSVSAGYLSISDLGQQEESPG